MESKSDNSSSMNTTNNNSHKGGQSDIEDVITNPREPWATKVQRIDHSDQVEDEEEDQLVVNPKFSAAPGEVVSTPTHNPEFLLSNDQVLETIAKSGISQSSCRTFQLTPTKQDDSSLVVTLAAANPLMGTQDRGYVTQVPCPLED